MSNLSNQPMRDNAYITTTYNIDFSYRLSNVIQNTLCKDYDDFFWKNYRAVDQRTN